MPSPASGERVMPVSSTACPCSSSQGFKRLICVLRPTPSVPSITINLPLRSEILIPARAFHTSVSSLHPYVRCFVEMRFRNLSHLRLLHLDRQSSVYKRSVKFRTPF